MKKLQNPVVSMSLVLSDWKKEVDLVFDSNYPLEVRALVSAVTLKRLFLSRKNIHEVLQSLFLNAGIDFNLSKITLVQLSKNRFQNYVLGFKGDDYYYVERSLNHVLTEEEWNHKL